MEKVISWSLKPYGLTLTIKPDEEVIKYYKDTGSSECWHDLKPAWIELYRDEIDLKKEISLVDALEQMTLEQIGVFVQLVEAKTSPSFTWSSSF